MCMSVSMSVSGLCLYASLLITCKHVRRIVRNDNSANTFTRVEMTLILALFHLLKPLTYHGTEKARVPAENALQRMPHTKARKS